MGLQYRILYQYSKKYSTNTVQNPVQIKYKILGLQDKILDLQY